MKSGSAEVDEQCVGDAGGAEGFVNSGGCSKELRYRSASCVARPSHVLEAIPCIAPAFRRVARNKGDGIICVVVAREAKAER